MSISCFYFKLLHIDLTLSILNPYDRLLKSICAEFGRLAREVIKLLDRYAVEIGLTLEVFRLNCESCA